MGALRDELQRDTAAAIAIYDQTFECNGRPLIPCTRKQFPAGYEFQDGGEVHKILEHITVARSVLAGLEIAVGDGIDLNSGQVKMIDPNAETLILYIGSFDEP
jgi:hypothetical protein